MTRDTAAVARSLQAAQTVAIVCHVNPDGDAIGSSLAMKLALEKLGKQVEVFNQDKVPDNLGMLRGSSAFRTPDTLTEEERFDLLLVIDVADRDRMGACEVLFDRCTHTAQLDHHGTNPMFCEQNAVDAGASAAALLVRETIGLLGVQLDTEISKCLYAAISTDTGNFAYSNTTAEAFHVMGELMESGLPLNDMNRVLFLEHDAAQVLLLQRALSTLTFTHGGEVTSMMLTRKDFEECHALPEHADTIVNYGSSIRGVRMTVLARETERGIKMSLRSLAPYSVSGIARAHGGGGHAQAAGCTIQGELAACTAQIVQELCEQLDAMS